HKSQLLSVPSELILMIIKILEDDGSFNDIKSLRLSCRALASAGREFLLHHIIPKPSGSLSPQTPPDNSSDELPRDPYHNTDAYWEAEVFEQALPSLRNVRTNQFSLMSYETTAASRLDAVLHGIGAAERSSVKSEISDIWAFSPATNPQRGSRVPLLPEFLELFPSLADLTIGVARCDAKPTVCSSVKANRRRVYMNMIMFDVRTSNVDTMDADQADFEENSDDEELGRDPIPNLKRFFTYTNGRWTYGTFYCAGKGSWTA
ncbi:hypothetical protein QBC35DRAFT_479068, partial [Podospora australis]